MDEECTGTTMRDYLRATDLTHVPDDLVALYDEEAATDGKLTYEHQTRQST
jgi:hypothetical protein